MLLIPLTMYKHCSSSFKTKYKNLLFKRASIIVTSQFPVNPYCSIKINGIFNILHKL